MRLASCLTFLSAALIAATGAKAVDGRQVFEECRSCHSLEPGAPPAAGPTLSGILGRIVAGDPAFGYSPALEAVRARGERWTGDALDRYLADPDEAVPGTWMSSRVRDAADRRALIDFLSDPSAR